MLAFVIVLTGLVCTKTAVIDMETVVVCSDLGVLLGFGKMKKSGGCISTTFNDRKFYPTPSACIKTTVMNLQDGVLCLRASGLRTFIDSRRIRMGGRDGSADTKAKRKVLGKWLQASVLPLLGAKPVNEDEQ